MTAEMRRDIASWWPRLPEDVRSELTQNLDREPMSSSAVVAVTAARGFGPAAVTFAEAEPAEHPRFFLAHDDYVWIAAASGQLRDDGQFQAAFPHDPGAIDRAVPADDEAFNRQFPLPERDIRDVAF